MRPTPAGSRGGFSVVEMLVVCTIAGIVLAASVPNLRSFTESQRVARAAEQIAAACRAAQARARSENHAIIVEYRPVENGYAVIDDENGNGQADAGETVTVHALGGGLELQATTFPGDQLVYDGRGRAVTSGNVLVAGGEHVQAKRVRVSSGTGQVKIQSGAY